MKTADVKVPRRYTTDAERSAYTKGYLAGYADRLLKVVMMNMATESVFDMLHNGVEHLRTVEGIQGVATKVQDRLARYGLVGKIKAG